MILFHSGTIWSCARLGVYSLALVHLLGCLLVTTGTCNIHDTWTNRVSSQGSFLRFASYANI